MGKKWKRLLVQRRKEVAAPARAPAPAVSNAAKIEEMKAAAPEPVEEVVEEAPMMEEEPVLEVPKPKRRKPTRRKKTTSED
jgi:hypothetical protein